MSQQLMFTLQAFMNFDKFSFQLILNDESGNYKNRLTERGETVRMAL